MRIPSKSESLAQYQGLKSRITQASETPGSGVQRNGDRLEVTRHLRTSDEVIIRAGSAVDDDPKTSDTIKLEQVVDGHLQQTSFTHYSEPRGWLFKRDQEFLKVQVSQDTLGGFSTLGVTHQL